MKKYGTLICLFLLMVVSRGFALDIYVNDILWHSYSSSDLNNLRVDLSAGSGERPGIPFSELLPLFSSLEALRIGIKGGEVLLEIGLESLRGSALQQSDIESWDLALNSSLYHAPSRIDLYGIVNPSRRISIWAEPGLRGMRSQIEVWGSLHKLEILYQEIPNMGDELIFRKITGDIMPDFVLRYLPTDEPFDQARTISYTLQSILASRGSQEIETLVLPTGFKIHPDLYLSILASLSDRESPFESTFMNDPEHHRKATGIYAGMILQHKIMELQDYQISDAFREGNYAFFPASSFPLQTGVLLSPGVVKGAMRPLSSRVLPLMLETAGEGYSPGTLLDFLKLPGIQYKLLSLPHRQLPSELTNLSLMAMDNMDGAAMDLMREWKQGFLLSRKNYGLISEVYRRLPDLLRNEGALP